MEDRLKPLDTSDIAEHYLGGERATVAVQVNRGRFPHSDYMLGQKSYWFKGTADAWKVRLISLYEATKEETQTLVRETDPQTGKRIGLKNKNKVNAIRYRAMEEATVHAEEVGAALKAQLLNDDRDGNQHERRR